ncbi:MAG TPA: bifunctional glutamate N-acetyltransferase/amino-acid acetyltransferase ArgJ [Actinomycetota bacterium]|nr:bifunctional glutamate N-acetyltransferase/amino-acid acetyltransferase ArgJ [Actinomycetota bacterium]
MSVTFPRGFRAAGTTAGLKPSGRPDLGLLVADQARGVAGLFTTNAFAAAPVRLSRQRLSRGAPRAVVVNSGQANAGTGVRGDRGAEETTAAVAAALQMEPSLVLACSTGVIGEPLDTARFAGAVPELVGALSPEGGGAFAEAILTTDTVAKEASAERGPYRIGGCAKGVGMVAPDLKLATMLAFLTTDAPVPAADLRRLAADVLEPRFESLTVDGCSSTNDSVLLFASGAAGGDLVVADTPAFEQVREALEAVASSLVVQLAHDAEGAHHVVLVEVAGAETDEDARAVARTVAESPLVKAAIFGGDPNPGRILQAIGDSGAVFLPQVVQASIGDVPVISEGQILSSYFEGGIADARKALQEKEIVITVGLGGGPGTGNALGVDLSYDYVRINAEYTT